MTEGEQLKKVLVVGSSWDKFSGSFLGNTKYWEYELSADIAASLARIASGDYDALLVEKGFFRNLAEQGDATREKSILDHLPVALVQVDCDQKILWYNRQFLSWSVSDDLIGKKFYIPLGRPAMRGPDFCPFRTIRMTGKPSFTTLYQQEAGRFLNMNTAPVFGPSGEITSFLVELHDVTDRNQEERILFRLREAGKELADLSKSDIQNLSPKERANILRAKIGKYAKEILQFDTIEIRILSHREPGLLEPLLAIGMAEEAKQRTLYARQEQNGITGWVAFHGKSYRMDDPTEDIFYIEGIPGARSSITVPLLYHESVIGTFNVESQQPNAFSENDLHLLEAYAEDVATAIHTLDLLSFEQLDSAFRSLETVYSDVVNPLNQILNDTTRLLASDLDDKDEMVRVLSEIQGKTREIQQVFQKHGSEIAPELRQETSEIDCRSYEMLRGNRILLIDSDSATGPQLSKILFFYGCAVETAQSGSDALKMIETTHYDAYISDVKLKDMSAYTFFEMVRDRLQVPFVPFIYMTGYGHDGGHVMTRAKLAGVLGYIFKPFKLPQLLKNLKLVVTEAEKQNHAPPEEEAPRTGTCG